MSEATGRKAVTLETSRGGAAAGLGKKQGENKRSVR